MSNGWEKSAAVWIERMGEHGDWGRQHVLDPVMLERIGVDQFRRALDIGCGEGRFCRILRSQRVDTVGIDPTVSLIEAARARHPDGDYHVARAEMIPLLDQSFDLVVSYLTLIDIADFRAGLAEMVRVLKPGGSLLIANLNGFITSCPNGSVKDSNGDFLHYPVDHYLEEADSWVEFSGLRIRNWHRPLSSYMKELLGFGLSLTYFDEPLPRSGDAIIRARYCRAPWFVVMEWRKDH